jgi:hypothetical protein
MAKFFAVVQNQFTEKFTFAAKNSSLLSASGYGSAYFDIPI